MILVFTIPSLLVLGLLGQLLGAAIAVLLGGLSETLIENTTKPNQGIWRSAKNGATLAFIGAILLSCTIGGMGYLLTRSAGLGIASFFLGLMIGLVKGWTACIKHGYLRLVLWGLGVAPWNYARFLNYATECIFLQQVGGGYVFIHRLLLEHFAERYLSQQD